MKREKGVPTFVVMRRASSSVALGLNKCMALLGFSLDNIIRSMTDVLLIGSLASTSTGGLRGRPFGGSLLRGSLRGSLLGSGLGDTVDSGLLGGRFGTASGSSGSGIRSTSSSVRGQSKDSSTSSGTGWATRRAFLVRVLLVRAIVVGLGGGGDGTSHCTSLHLDWWQKNALQAEGSEVSMRSRCIW